jgi:hypothetical protein
MTERPIRFSGPMVRAILERRKTQTRRVVLPQPTPSHGGWIAPLPWVEGISSNEVEFEERGEGGHRPLRWTEPAGVVRCPYGAPGDRLWVRETFYIDLMPFDLGRLPNVRPAELEPEHVYYRADGECCDLIPECSCREVGKPRWRPSTQMPRWASRIALELVGVRVEQLQAITAADCKAEGVVTMLREADAVKDLGDRFRGRWDSRNGDRGCGWDANPWVWVLEFKLVEAA